MSTSDVKPTAAQLGCVTGRPSKDQEREIRTNYHEEQKSLEVRRKLLKESQKLEERMLDREGEMLRDKEKHRRLQNRLFVAMTDTKTTIPHAMPRIKPEPVSVDEDVQVTPPVQGGQGEEKDGGMADQVEAVQVAIAQKEGDQDDDDEIVFVEEKLLGGSGSRPRLTPSVSVKTERDGTPEPYEAIRHPSLSPVLGPPDVEVSGDTSARADKRGIKRARGGASSQPTTSSSVGLAGLFDDSDEDEHDYHNDHLQPHGNEGESARPPPRKKPKQHSGKKVDKPRTKRPDNKSKHRVKTDKKKKPGTQHHAHPSSSDEESDSEQSVDRSGGGHDHADDDDDEEIEWSTRYAGPALSTLSRKAIDRYLSRVLRDYHLSNETIGEMAQWWPKTKLQYQHSLDKPQMWLLTQSVTLWWKGLFVQLGDPTYHWPKKFRNSRGKQLSMRSRVEEIYYDKKKHSVRAQREMEENGKVIAIGKVYQLD